MVNLFSRRDGPRPEDARIKNILRENSATITRLADHLSLGAYSQSKKPRPKPRAKGLIFHYGLAQGASEPLPRVRTSLNGRLLVVDDNSGRQMHHLGDLRRRGDKTIVVLATAANGYGAPVEERLAAALADFDGRALGVDYGEDRLTADVAEALGIAV